MAFLLQVQETYIEEWHDCYLSESKKTGFVCTLQLANKKHRFYGLNDLDALLKEAKKRKTDVYLSLNAFEYGSRTTKTLKQIRNIGVDLDCYKVNVSVPKALEEIKQLIIKGKIPNPNLVIFSGRGLQLIYSISGGAAPAMAFLTQYISERCQALLLKHQTPGIWLSKSRTVSFACISGVYREHYRQSGCLSAPFFRYRYDRWSVCGRRILTDEPISSS